MRKIFKDFNLHHIFFIAILLAIFLLRLPSLFEPFWYGDEGIFAAVARNLNFGGVLYQTAWDNKPPFIYLTYAAIFQFFGVSMFYLRLAALGVVLITAAVVYEIAEATIGKRRALWASGIFGFITSLRLVEGNLALTEIFMILPISLAMLVAIKRKFDFLSLFAAGFLFACASLFKQVGAFEAVALGLFLFLEPQKLSIFLKRGFVLAFGFSVPLALTGLYFWTKGILGEYIFGAYTYYSIYLNESPQYAIFINTLKYLPIAAVFSYGFWKRRQRDLSFVNLFLLWMAFSFLGSFFSGRTYGHYLIQAVPPLALVLSSIKVKRKVSLVQMFFWGIIIIPLIVLGKILFGGSSENPIGPQISYWQNFIDYAAGSKSTNSYNDYFDKNVNKIMGASDFLARNGGRGKSVYIWGDYPWLYAISDLHNPSRYVTSFHVFGVPGGKDEVILGILKDKPIYILKPASSIGYFEEFEKIIFEEYTFVLAVEDVKIFRRNEF